MLRWDARNEAAIDGLKRLRQGDEVGAAVGVLEIAAAQTALSDDDPSERLAATRRAIELGTDDKDKARFYGIRRLLWLSGCDDSVLVELGNSAEATGA